MSDVPQPLPSTTPVLSHPSLPFPGAQCGGADGEFEEGGSELGTVAQTEFRKRAPPPPQQAGELLASPGWVRASFTSMSGGSLEGTLLCRAPQSSAFAHFFPG